MGGSEIESVCGESSSRHARETDPVKDGILVKRQCLPVMSSSQANWLLRVAGKG